VLWHQTKKLESERATVMTEPLSSEQLLRQAQELQEQLTEQRKEISTTVVEGSAGGGAVKVGMRADGTVLKVHIDPDVVHISEIDMLEDLVAAAFRDALRRCGNAQAAAMTRVNAPSHTEGEV
jgi:DNA-binding YbaB/EbfC family protein